MDLAGLIRLLSDGDYHSGEELGKQLNVSRTAIWKQLRRLEAAGVTLEAVRGRGYRLHPPIEPLDDALIAAALSTDAKAALVEIFIKESLTSTNLFLQKRFQAGRGHAEFCLAEHQMVGRGRRGRQWLAGWGRGLILSAGWRFQEGAVALEGLSLAVGVAIAEVLEKYALNVKLKWPNDVLMMVEGRGCKLAGILLELGGDVNGPCEVVLGIGLNIQVDTALRSQVEQPIAAVHDQVPTISRNQLAGQLVAKLLELLPHFECEGFAPWRTAWNQHNAHAGKEIIVTQGARQYVAIDEGVDERGHLIVRCGHERLRLAGGEISLRERL